MMSNVGINWRLAPSGVSCLFPKGGAVAANGFMVLVEAEVVLCVMLTGTAGGPLVRGDFTGIFCVVGVFSLSGAGKRKENICLQLKSNSYFRAPATPKQ